MSEQQRDYTAWLLENHDTGTPRYYAMTALQEMVWVEDVDDAVHFARREDAERPAEYGELHDLRVVEHLWPGGLPRKPVVPPDDINNYAGLSYQSDAIQTAKDAVIEAARVSLGQLPIEGVPDRNDATLSLAKALKELDKAEGRIGVAETGKGESE